jgi:hypothetical protein
MADKLDYLKSLGLSIARGVPQVATGMVDLAALPFTATGLLKPEEAVGSTDWMTKKGLLPPAQKGLLNETTEMLSGAINPSMGAKAGLLGVAGMFAGTGAKTADTVKLAVAEAMEQTGKNAEDIRKATGWKRGAEGRWKFEIDDSKSKVLGLGILDRNALKKNRKVTLPIESVIDHPEYFQAYPEMRKAMVVLDPSKPGAGGLSYDDNAKRYILTVYADPSKGAADRSIMLHEMMHPIQEIENFAKGISPELVPFSDLREGVLERVNKRRLKSDDLMAEGKYPEAMRAQKRANNLLTTARYDAYRRTPGEVEARAVQERMDYPPALRKAIPPESSYDVDIEKMVRSGLLKP